ncbi:hypothetical protein F511_38185 [Dorcoceras hygrometricum]|uniref:Uncharacterized protein n=1 Tax=Dorcoceras hygrometricum TaxID=472368 RepID=A0A2Z7CQP8_9LAMI|nr:hypothetical protein F511_38185 [Dorcoceras hygrometricum]
MSGIRIPGPMNLCSCYYELMDPCVHGMVKWQHRGVRDPEIRSGELHRHEFRSEPLVHFGLGNPPQIEKALFEAHTQSTSRLFGKQLQLLIVIFPDVSGSLMLKAHKLSGRAYREQVERTTVKLDVNLSDQIRAIEALNH